MLTNMSIESKFILLSNLTLFYMQLGKSHWDSLYFAQSRLFIHTAF